IAKEERRARVRRILLAEAENTFISALPGHEGLEIEPPDLALAYLDFQVPSLSGCFLDFHLQFLFRAGKELKIYIVTQPAVVYREDSIACFEPEFMAEAAFVDGRYLDA